MAREHASPIHDPLLFEHTGGNSHELYPPGLPSVAEAPSGLQDPFNGVPIFPSLGMDTIQGEPPIHHTPFGSQSTSMLWQDLKQEIHDPAWQPSSDMLHGDVAGLSLDTPLSQRTRPSGSISSDNTLGEQHPTPSVPEQPTPLTPVKPQLAHAAPHPTPPPASSLDDETPVKAANERPADDAFHGNMLYELNATPPNLVAQGMPPMTPMHNTRRPSLDEPRNVQTRTHRSGPSISSSSALSASTPEYGSTHSIASSADLRSPGIPVDGPRMDLSPHKSATVPYSAEVYTAMQGYPMCYNPVPFTPQSAASLSRAGLHGPLSLDEPFGTPEQFMSPHAHAAPMTMSPGLLFHDNQPDPKLMSRVSSAPSLHSPLPPWPPEPEMGMYTPSQEAVSFPASPASCSANLPVNCTAMARKCYTPYAKTPHSTTLYSSPLEMDPFFSQSGMTSSKSMNAIASSVPPSPLTPSAPGRRRSQLSESVSMPGDQMTSLLEYEATQTATRSRGRNAGPPPLVVSSADKLHVCHCGRRFKRMEHLKRHNRTHTQERPHKCPVESCGKSFGRSDNLAQHLKTHYRPSGLVGRTSDMHHAELGEPARPRDRRHDPYAAAAAAASAAAASAAFAADPETKTERPTEVPPA